MKNLNWHLLALGWIVFLFATAYGNNTLYFVADFFFVASIVVALIKRRCK